MDKVEKTHNKSQSERDDKDVLNYSQAVILSKIDNPQEQKELAKVLKNSKEQRVREQEKLMVKYKEAPEKVKAKVRKGDIDLDDVEDESYVEKLKENHKGEKSTFIPSFRERLCELDNQLIRLEQSVDSFDTIFNSKEFMEQYLELDVKYQKDFNGLVTTIHDRMQGLTKTVSSFMGKFIETKKLLGVGVK
jgi:hypothetical protein